MTFPFLIPACRLSGIAIFLLGVAGTQLSSAAETSFGPGGKYSLELPAGWTAKPGTSDAVVGGKSGGVNFTANAFPTKLSPEEIMAKAIANSEKRAGYKLIEKGSVKSAGRTAQVFRFEVDEGTGPFMGVNYYFKNENDVVVLIFGIASGVPTSIKSEIEAILNSVKAGTAAGAADDTWTTAPAEKPKPDSKLGGGEDSKIAGRYVNGSDYIELKADGTLSFEISGEAGAGTYTHKGTTVTLNFGDGDSDDAKLENGALVDHGGKRWVRKTESSSSPSELSKKPDAATPADAGAKWPCAIDTEAQAAVAKAKLGSATTIPGTDASIRFPAGWTEEAGKWSNKTLIVFRNADMTSRIAVHGRVSTTLVAYLKNLKKKPNTEFRPGDVCDYKLAGVHSATAVHYQITGPGADDVETHALFSFPNPGSKSGEITLVDCHTSGQMEPNDAGLFEAIVQSLKLPSANSR